MKLTNSTPILISDLRNNPELVAERERQQQADELCTLWCAFDNYRSKPGDFIKKWGHRFPRLMELKAHHFNTRSIVEFLPKRKRG